MRILQHHCFAVRSCNPVARKNPGRLAASHGCRRLPELRFVGGPPEAHLQAPAFLSGCAPLAFVFHDSPARQRGFSLRVCSPSLCLPRTNRKAAGQWLVYARGCLLHSMWACALDLWGPLLLRVPLQFSLGPQGAQLPCVATRRHYRGLGGGEAVCRQEEAYVLCSSFHPLVRGLADGSS